MKKISLIIKISLFLYVALYLLFVYISTVKYSDMDFNKNGFIELSEAFQAIVIDTRSIKKFGQEAIEYYTQNDRTILLTKYKKMPKSDQVIVKKSQHRLYLMKKGRVIKEYRVVFGANPKGDKLQQGDERTPEGKYTLDYKKSNSSFYRAIHISYPDRRDRREAKKMDVSPGGLIMIHGQKNGLEKLSPIAQIFNWTDGCIALSNDDMHEVWQSVNRGTPIQILP